MSFVFVIVFVFVFVPANAMMSINISPLNGMFRVVSILHAH